MITAKKQFLNTKSIHFVGIGGIGMSGIAHIVASLGYEISGSDLASSEITNTLKANGATIFFGKHRKENLPFNTNVLVTSTAISPANPEVIEAKERGIPIIRRAEMLAEIMRLKTGIAIAGTHGKTTTTSLVTAICEAAALSPTSIIGGKSFSINSNAKFGESEYLICEADESDGSFLDLSPVYNVVTNIDWDHMEFYGSQEKVLLHFLQFINKTPFYGKSILCFEDPNVCSIANAVKKPFASYAIAKQNKGAANNANYLAHNIEYKKNKTTFNVQFPKSSKENTMPIALPMLGKHNVLNALAAIGVCNEIGIKKNAIKKGLESFAGVERRLTKMGTWNGIDVYDDYAHHPKEIEATLQAVINNYTHVTVIFQPHRYSRTLQLYKEFAKTLATAHSVYLTPIYTAGEEPIENVNSQLILNLIETFNPKCKAATLNGSNYLQSFLQAENNNKAITNKPRLIITMGAGDIYKTAKSLVKL